ncbi:hypothetical protein MUK42_22366 [Musa troglodytarum]|uniref:Uncharacterized protein n=1 Tax=Musa troglodytarum TaxID=320322 RepID=A0A9E7IBL2_9LILI|nr:hypothetical protein MUK42_22366 [Musa troglodytarum]
MAVGSSSRMATLRTMASLPMPRPPGGPTPHHTPPPVAFLDGKPPVADPSGLSTPSPWSKTSGEVGHGE